jgi:hypothetical protein
MRLLTRQRVNLLRVSQEQRNTGDVAARRSEIVPLEIERNPSGVVACKTLLIDFTEAGG